MYSGHTKIKCMNNKIISKYIKIVLPIVDQVMHMHANVWIIDKIISKYLKVENSNNRSNYKSYSAPS